MKDFGSRTLDSCVSCVAFTMAAAAFDFDLDGDMALPLPAKLDNVDARSPKTWSGPPESKGLELRVTAGFMHPCDCCGQEEKVKGSRFGAECKKALNNITNTEKKRGCKTHCHIAISVQMQVDEARSVAQSTRSGPMRATRYWPKATIDARGSGLRKQTELFPLPKPKTSGMRK